MRQYALLVTVALVTSCGSEGPAAPAGRDLRGTWDYSASGISPGVSLVCAVSGAQVAITTHSGTGFAGTHTSGQVVCTGSGSTNFSVGTGIVVSAVANGDSVRFNFDNANYRHFGTIQADTMSGILNLSVILNGTSPTVATGTWRLVKR